MYAEAVQILNNIERSCDPATLQYHGVSYWPLARLRLWSQLLQRMVMAKRDGDVVSKQAAPAMPTEQPDVEFAGPQEWGLLRLLDKSSKAAKIEPVQALFFLRPEEYSDTVGGAAFAKTGDSVYERARSVSSALKVELLNPASLSSQRRYPSLFLHLEMASAGVRFDPPGTLENFAALKDAVEKSGAGLVLDQTTLTTDMGKIFYFARIFEKALRTLGPKALFLSVYYHLVGMAWMLACRRAGVRSVDVQHGRLGPHEANYTQLISAPEDGYHLSPDTVWCWGKQTKHDIEVDKNKRCARHGGIIGGNAWLAKWRYGDAANLEPPEAQAFADAAAGRRRILVSLQLYAKPLVPELLDAMRRSPPSWLWLLRVHPLRKHMTDEIAATARQAGVQNFEIHRATTLPLFSLLRIAEHHVTVFSSTVAEAAAFNLRTSLIGSEALQIFQPQLAAGVCRYTPTADAVLAHTTEMLAAPEPLHDDFIDMSEGIADRALAALLA